MNVSKQPIWTKDFLSISFVNLIVFITFYALFTTLPIYVIYDIEGTEAQAGLIVTVMLISAILMRPFSGNILARFNKRNVLMISTVIFAVTSVAYIWVDQFIPLMILRFIHGLSFGLLTTTTSTIAANIVPIERKGEGLGYFVMFMNVAIVIGPFMGLTLTQFMSFQQLFIVLSLFGVISVISSSLVQVQEVVTSAISKTKRKLSIHDFFELKAMPISLIGLLVAFAYSGIISFISVYAIEAGLEKFSGYFFLVFAVTMLVTRPYLGRVFDERGPKIVILPCLIIFAVGLVMLSVAGSAWLFLLAAGVIGIGYGSILPFLLSLSTEAISKKRTGHATATFFTFYDSGITAGSITLGFLVPYTGFGNLFILLAIFVICTTITFSFLNNRMQEVSTEKGFRQKQSTETHEN